MNIVFFHINGISKTRGGVSRITDTLSRVFRKNGNKVWLLGERNDDKTSDYDESQVFLPDYEDLESEENVLFVLSFIKQESIDIVINQAAQTDRTVRFLAIVKERSNVKLFSCFHNSILTPIYHGAYLKEFELRKKHMGFVFNVMRVPIVNKLLVRVYIRKNRNRYLKVVETSDKVVVLCEGQKRELTKMCGGIDEKKIVIIPNIQEPADYIFDSGDKENIVLWVGTFDNSIKRPDYMLRIWQKVQLKASGWKLLMLGDGPSFEEIKQMALSMHLSNIEFVGRVNPMFYYRKASLLCVTSVHESFSLVVTEGHCYGVVPIAFNSFTAATIIINDGIDGVLVKPFDLDEYADKLLWLMKKNSNRLRMANMSRESLKIFAPDQVYRHWKKVMND